jgi:hypothetical protein
MHYGLLKSRYNSNATKYGQGENLISQLFKPNETNIDYWNLVNNCIRQLDEFKNSLTLENSKQMWDSISDSISDHEINLEIPTIESRDKKDQELSRAHYSDVLNNKKAKDAEKISLLDLTRIDIIKKISEKGVLASLYDKIKLSESSKRYSFSNFNVKNYVGPSKLMQDQTVYHKSDNIDKNWLMIFNSVSKYSDKQLVKLSMVVTTIECHYKKKRENKALDIYLGDLFRQNKIRTNKQANLEWQKLAYNETVTKAITAYDLEIKTFNSETNSKNDTVDLKYLCDYYTFVIKLRKTQTIREGPTWQDRLIVKKTFGDKTLEELEQTGMKTNMVIPKSNSKDPHLSHISNIISDSYKIGNEMHRANYGIYPLKQSEVALIRPYNTRCSEILVGNRIDSEIHNRALEMCKNKYESSPVNGSKLELEHHMREALKILLNDTLFEGQCDISRMTWKK